MPLVPDSAPTPGPFDMATGVLPAEPVGIEPGIGDTIAAAFRTQNTVGSALTRAGDTGAGEATDVWGSIKGTPYEEYWDSFAPLTRREQVEAMKAQIDGENRDRQTIAGAGWLGTIASIGASVVDPAILVPVGGEISLAGKGAWRLGRGAAAGARAGLVGGALYEGALQRTQETRTAEESAITIGGSVVLGSLLGAGATALLSRGEQTVAQDAIETIARVHSEGSVGAAQAQAATIGDLTVAGPLAERVARASKLISPNLRANFREAPAARQFSQELAENTLYQGMHEEGRSLGASVETLMRSTQNSRMVTAVEAHNGIFREMKKNPAFNMRQEAFDEAVGRAMRRSDEDANPFVQRAAQAWRAKVIDPFKDEAIDLGLLPADVGVDTAASYFTRVWNRERLTAQEPQFKQIVTDYYGGRLAQDYGESVKAVQGRLQSLEQEVSDLRLSPADRQQALDDLEKQGISLEADAPHLAQASGQISDLRKAARAAKDRGDTAAEQAAKDQITRIVSEHGKKLSEFSRKRAQVRIRQKRIGLNYAGMTEKADRVGDQIDSLSESTNRSVQRIVNKGRALEREAQRLDPDKLRQKVSDLRTSFYDLITRSEKAAERNGKSIERLKAEGDVAGATTRLERAHAAEAARVERLSSISRRLEAAESLDPHASLAEIKASIDDTVREISDAAMVRGAKAERLQARLAKLDPKKLDARIAAIGELRAKLEREFYDRWEVGRLGDGVDIKGGTPDFRSHASQIADDVFDKLTGRAMTNSGTVDPEFMTAITRGPLKERTFSIPDRLVEDFLHHNVREVGERYSRTMAAEIELTRRFGHADMRDQIAKVRDEYRELRAAAGEDEAKLRALTKDERGAIEDLEAMRDLVRGTYKAHEVAGNYGRVVRSLMAFNYIRTMGGALIANIAELYRPAMVHGLGRYLSQGVAPLMNNMAAIKLSVKEARLAGQVTERLLQNRMLSLGEVADPYRSGTAIERLLSNATRIGSKWNGLVYWTDGMKAISSVLSQNRIIEAAVSPTGKDARLLAYLGIDRDMSERIGREFAKHGEVIDNVKVASTQNWTDQEAVRAYRAAVSKDVDSIIVTKSVGDVPLFAATPTGKMILQFRNYTFAAHQRITLRAMQEDKAQFISGMVGMAALGMLGATLRSWRGGEDRFERFRKAAANPGYLIGEGLDLSGMFALPIELGNTTEKLTQAAGYRFNPVKTPLSALGQVINPDAPEGGGSTRFASRDPLSSVLGPTAGLPWTVAKALGAAPSVAMGDSLSRGQATAASSLLPFNSYLGMREMIQVLTEDSPYLQ